MSCRLPISSLLVAAAAALALGACSDRIPAPPRQPIEFSHRIHAGVNHMGCLMCHSYAARGPVAGIPSMARCEGCHKFIKSDPTNPVITAQIKALETRLDDGKPIDWIRVHRLPDYVYFTHQRHVLAGVQCSECHGDVAQMDEARQVAPLTMGWCLDCHRRKQAERPLERAYLTDCLTCHK